MTTPAHVSPKAAATTVSHRGRRGRRPSHASPWASETSFTEQLLKVLFIGGLLVAVLVPMAMVVVTSLSGPRSVSEQGGLVLIPKDLSLAAYQMVLSGGAVTKALIVSLVVTSVGTITATVMTILCSYGLSRPGSLWHRPILFTVLLTYLIGPSLIPVYLTMQTLHLLNTYAALVVPGLVSAFNIIILRTFFLGLPQELLDSARIDGAGEFTILRRIVLPLSKAPIAVVALFTAVSYWNSFFTALLYLNDANKWPLQLVLRQYVLQGQPVGVTNPNQTAQVSAPEVSVQMAVVVLAMIPVLIVYPFVQKHFVKGVVLGAVKG